LSGHLGNFDKEKYLCNLIFWQLEKLFLDEAKDPQRLAHNNLRQG
jgi:hypothetical protein